MGGGRHLRVHKDEFARPPRRWLTRSDTSSGSSTTARLARRLPHDAERRGRARARTHWRRLARPGSSRRGRRARRRLSTRPSHISTVCRRDASVVWKRYRGHGRGVRLRTGRVRRGGPMLRRRHVSAHGGVGVPETQGAVRVAAMSSPPTRCAGGRGLRRCRDVLERRRSVPRTRVSRWGRRAWRITAIRARAGQRRARTASGRVSDGGRTAVSASDSCGLVSSDIGPLNGPFTSAHCTGDSCVSTTPTCATAPARTRSRR